MYKKKKLQGLPIQGQGGADTALKRKKTEEQKLKILFFHNTLPEYRIGWFSELSKVASIEFVFTNESLNKKNYGFDIDYERSDGLHCTFLNEGKKGVRQLANILAEVQKYDFVELPPIDSLREVVCGIKIVKACKKNKVKIGYFWEKWEAPENEQPVKRKIKNMILRIIPKAIYKNADVIYAAGRKSKEYFISNGIDEEKIVVIPDASETPMCEYEDIRDKYGIQADKKVVMFLGRLIPQKGVRYLIKAFAGLNSEIRENCHLLIAGDGYERKICEELAKDLKIGNVTFTGAVNPRVRGNYFSQCDVFVYPVTYYDGRVDVWGLTLNEAVQHGKIVIATDAVGSAYELIEDGVNGFKVEPGNVEMLKDAMEKAININQLKPDAVTGKDATLMKVFNFHAMAKKYVEKVKEFTEIEKNKNKDL